MRILEIVHGLGTGGIEINLATRLKYAPKEIQTTVVNTKYELSDLSGTVSRLADTYREMSWLTLLHQLQKKSFLDRFDIIIVHVAWQAVMVLSSLTPRFVPIVFVAHSMGSKDSIKLQGIQRRLLPTVNHRARKHIAVSGSVSRTWLCHKAQHVEVVYLGVGDHCPIEKGRTAKLWAPGTRLKYLAGGRFISSKKHESILAAVSLIRDEMLTRGAKLVMIGHGSRLSHLQQMIEELDLVNLVSISAKPKLLPQAMNVADLFVSTSSSEGGPMTIYEALSVGTSVLSTPTGAALDLVPMDPASILLDDPSVESIAIGILVKMKDGPINPNERAERSRKFRFLGPEDSAVRFYQSITSH